MQFKVEPNKKLKMSTLPNGILCVPGLLFLIWFTWDYIKDLIYVSGISQGGVEYCICFFGIGGIILVSRMIWDEVKKGCRRYVFQQEQFACCMGKYGRRYDVSDITECVYERYGEIHRDTRTPTLDIKIKKKSYRIYMDYHSNFVQVYDWLKVNNIAILGDEILENEFETSDFEEVKNRLHVEKYCDENITMTAVVKPVKFWLVKNYFNTVFVLWLAIYVPFVVPIESIAELFEKTILILMLAFLSQILVAMLGWLLKKEYYIEQDGIIIKTLLKTKKYAFDNLDEVSFQLLVVSRAHKMTSELSFYVGSKKYWLYGHDYDNLEGFVKMLNTKIKVVTR